MISISGLLSFSKLLEKMSFMGTSKNVIFRSTDLTLIKRGA